jgi:hypothetical protein
VLVKDEAMNRKREHEGKSKGLSSMEEEEVADDIALCVIYEDTPDPTPSQSLTTETRKPPFP